MWHTKSLKTYQDRTMNLVRTSLRKILLLTGALLVFSGIGYPTLAGDVVHKGPPIVFYKETFKDGIVIGTTLQWGVFFEQGRGLFRVSCTADEQHPNVRLTVFAGQLIEFRPRAIIPRLIGADITLVSDAEFEVEIGLALVRGSGNLSERAFDWSLRDDARNLLTAISDSNKQLQIKVEFDAEDFTFNGKIDVAVNGPHTGGRSLKAWAGKMLKTCGL